MRQTSSFQYTSLQFFSLLGQHMYNPRVLKPPLAQALAMFEAGFASEKITPQQLLQKEIIWLNKVFTILNSETPEQQQGFQNNYHNN